MEYHLNSPLTASDVVQPKIGDSVYISGNAFTCRSRLQKYVLDEGNILPFKTSDRNILIHSGPVVIKENGKWQLVSFMPTSSLRFEKWGASSISEWGLKMIVGKTTMGRETTEMMKIKKCVHVSPQSVSPNLWIDSISIEGVHLFNELGTIEAAWQLKLKDLGPFIVDIDCEGRNLFDEIDVQIARNKKTALNILDINENYNFTKLY